MTQELKRTKLAEAAGWINCKVRRHPNHNKIDNMEPDKLLFGINPEKTGVWKVPNYFHDLNAVHELEKVLTEKEQRDYVFRLLLKLVDGSVTNDLNDHFIFIRATAAQRAEAIGLTLGLWTA